MIQSKKRVKPERALLSRRKPSFYIGDKMVGARLLSLLAVSSEGLVYCRLFAESSFRTGKKKASFKLRVKSGKGWLIFWRKRVLEPGKQWV